jgi:cell division septal protein FtsQ
MRFIKLSLSSLYLGLALFGGWSFFNYALSDIGWVNALVIQDIHSEITMSHKSQALKIKPLIDELKNSLKGIGYFRAKKTLKSRLASEPWISQTWVSYHYPQKMNITLVPKYIWGYVYVTDQKRFYAVSSEGALWETPVIPEKVSTVSQQLFLKTKLDTPMQKRVQEDYDAHNELVGRFGLSISQYKFDPQYGATLFLSNGVVLNTLHMQNTLVLEKLEQTLQFLKQRHSEINSIQFISSKKVVVSFRH